MFINIKHQEVEIVCYWRVESNILRVDEDVGNIWGSYYILI